MTPIGIIFRSAFTGCPYRKTFLTYRLMQSAQNGLCLDSPKSLNPAVNGASLHKRQVSASCVVVIHVGQQYVAQVPLAEHDDMVKTLPADRADQALGIAILPRRARRRRMVANAECPNAAMKTRP